MYNSKFYKTKFPYIHWLQEIKTYSLISSSKIVLDWNKQEPIVHSPYKTDL